MDGGGFHNVSHKRRQVGNASGRGILNLPAQRDMRTSAKDLERKLSEISRASGDFSRHPGQKEVLDRLRRRCCEKLEFYKSKYRADRSLSDARMASFCVSPTCRGCACGETSADPSRVRAPASQVQSAGGAASAAPSRVRAPASQGQSTGGAASAAPNRVRAPASQGQSAGGAQRLSAGSAQCQSAGGAQRQSVGDGVVPAVVRRQLAFPASSERLGSVDIGRTGARNAPQTPPARQLPQHPPAALVVPRMNMVQGGLKEKISIWRTGKATTAGLGPFPPAFKISSAPGRRLAIAGYDSWSVSGHKWWTSSSSKQAHARLRALM